MYIRVTVTHVHVVKYKYRTCMSTGKLVVSGSEFAITFRGFRTSKMLVRQHVSEDLSKIYVEPREQMEFILYTLRKYRGLQQFRTDIMCGTSNRHDICVRKDTDTLTSTRTHAQHVHTHIATRMPSTFTLVQSYFQ